MVVVDPKGNIVLSVSGGDKWDQINKVIEDALEE